MSKIYSFIVSIILAPFLTHLIVLLDGSEYRNIFEYFIDSIRSLLDTEFIIPHTFIGFFVYLIFGEYFTKIFNNIAYSREQKNNEKKQELAIVKEQDRKYYEKKRDLDLELQHLEKVMRLQANFDQAKMDKLKEMQRDLANKKQADLEVLRNQIDAMKR